MKLIRISLIVFLILNSKVEASFDRIGVGSRAIGMGTAFVAVANDASAIFWNPAGIGILSDSTTISRHFLLSYSPLYGLSYLQHKFIGYTQDRLLSSAQLGAFGLGIIELDLSPNTGDVQSLHYVENTFLISWANSFSLKPIFHRISIGTTFKYYHVQTARPAFGYGFDIGLLGYHQFKLSSWLINICFGFSAQDVGKSSIWYQRRISSNRREFVEPNYRMGFAIDIKSNRMLFQGLRFSFDLNRRDRYSVTRNELSLGTELSLHRNFDLRFGIQDLNAPRYAFGCGIILPKFFLSSFKVMLDGAVLTHPDLNNTVIFSISIFNGNRP